MLRLFSEESGRREVGEFVEGEGDVARAGDVEVARGHAITVAHAFGLAPIDWQGRLWQPAILSR